MEDIIIQVPAGKTEEYKKLAEAEGKSLSQFIIDRIEGKLTSRQIAEFIVRECR